MTTRIRAMPAKEANVIKQAKLVRGVRETVESIFVRAKLRSKDCVTIECPYLFPHGMHQRGRWHSGFQKKNTAVSLDGVWNEGHRNDGDLRAKVFKIAKDADNLESDVLRRLVLSCKSFCLELPSNRIVSCEKLSCHNLVDYCPVLRRSDVAL